MGSLVVITGPSDGGLGAEFATTLASALPGRIILAGRNEAKVKAVIARIKEISTAIEVSFIELELADNESVRNAARAIDKTVDKIDVLINNAGIAGNRKYQVSSDGVEQHFAANFLGHFLLTNLVLPKIVSARGTIINLTSMAYTLAEVNTEDVNFKVLKTS